MTDLGSHITWPWYVNCFLVCWELVAGTDSLKDIFCLFNFPLFKWDIWSHLPLSISAKTTVIWEAVAGCAQCKEMLFLNTLIDAYPTWETETQRLRSCILQKGSQWAPWWGVPWALFCSVCICHLLCQSSDEKSWWRCSWHPPAEWTWQEQESCGA